MLADKRVWSSYVGHVACGWCWLVWSSYHQWVMLADQRIWSSYVEHVACGWCWLTSGSGVIKIPPEVLLQWSCLCVCVVCMCPWTKYFKRYSTNHGLLFWWQPNLFWPRGNELDFEKESPCGKGGGLPIMRRWGNIFKCLKQLNGER